MITEFKQTFNSLTCLTEKVKTGRHASIRAKTNSPVNENEESKLHYMHGSRTASKD